VTRRVDQAAGGRARAIGGGHLGRRAANAVGHLVRCAANARPALACAALWYPGRMRTILISKADAATAAMRALPYDESVREALGKPVEALSPPGRGRLVCCSEAHPFAEAAHEAFFKHYPLVVSPDAVWFCLAQGFAHHIALNAERLRSRLVRHAGKHTLKVIRPDFTLGAQNPWPEVFAEFSDQIAQHVGRLREFVVAEFSTTGPLERAAFEVALMDAFQPYFNYLLTIGCGIPQIVLLGTPDDWRALRRRAELFAEFDLEAWTRALLPVIDAIGRAAEGHDDLPFWRSLFRYESTSGGNEVTGWLNVLFPYLRASSGRGGLEPNPYLDDWAERYATADGREARGERLAFDGCQGPALRDFPSGLASAPLELFDAGSGETHAMRFVAGLFGVAQDEDTLALSPAFGWAVVYDGDGVAVAPRPRPRWATYPQPALDEGLRRALDVVLAAPEDDAPRLAYAALLRGRGDPRGAFIEAQIEAARATDVDARKRANELADALAEQHARRWCAPFGLFSWSGLFYRGFIPCLGPIDSRACFENVDVPGLIAHEPVAQLYLEGVDLHAARWLGELEEGLRARFEVASFDNHELDADGQRVLFRSLLSFGRLKHLHVSYDLDLRPGWQEPPPPPRGEDAVRALADTPLLARLNDLGFDGFGLDSAGLAVLLGSAHLGRLEALSLRRNALGPDGIRALAAWPGGATLRTLDLGGNPLGDEGVRLLVESPHLGALEALSLDTTGFGEEGARALAACPRLAGLKRLTVRARKLGEEGTRLLRESPYLRGATIR
jgi:uncharacterized protein (TIGR02996 family)